MCATLMKALFRLAAVLEYSQRTLATPVTPFPPVPVLESKAEALIVDAPELPVVGSIKIGR